MFDFLKSPVSYKIDRFYTGGLIAIQRFRIIVKYRYIPFGIWIDTSSKSKHFLNQIFRKGTSWNMAYQETTIHGYARSWFSYCDEKGNQENSQWFDF